MLFLAKRHFTHKIELALRYSNSLIEVSKSNTLFFIS